MNPECDRFVGRKRLICLGEAGLSLQKTNAYRRLWGLPPLDALGEPVAPTSVGVVPELPPLLERVWTFGAALAKHACNGFRRRTKEQISEILESHCRQCEFFAGQHCTRCG